MINCKGKTSSSSMSQKSTSKAKVRVKSPLEDFNPKFAQKIEEYRNLANQREKAAENETNLGVKQAILNEVKSLREAIAHMEAAHQRFLKKEVKEAKEMEAAQEVKDIVKEGRHAMKYGSSFAEIVTSKKMSKAKSKDNKGTAKKVLDQRDIAATCVKSFYENIPPSICWKKGADVGIIPTGCPDGFFRKLALCFQYCKSGWSFDGAALCIKNCPPDTTTYPLTCTHWDWRVWKIWTVGREPYFPKSITNFEAPCPAGYYRGGALCYRDCNKIQMSNCGIGMCAADGPSCGAGIATMVTDFLVGLAKGISFVLSFGTSSAAQGGVAATKSSLKTLASKAGNAIKKGFKIMQNIAKNASVRKAFLDRMKAKAMEKLKEFVIDKAIEQTVSFICGKVGDGILDKSATKDENSSFSIDKLDVLGVGEIKSKCTGMKNDNDKVMCSKSILSSLDMIDPTGLCAMASAFMQPVCDV